ncbi:MAG: aminotransferase class I/II-fold pyridoxal phosphate-dependent enzyme, partial [Candidatus Hydrogenedentes bacterium]|nr:aminotransferase class I/II-fold pyridoxal phosphate-dependent enzyme [Candidatus Hydrogenedentota bacterium]
MRAEVFNVGRDDNNFQIAELANLVKRHFPEAHVETVLGDEDRRSYRVSFGKMAKMLGFEASYSVEDGLQQVRQMFDDGIVADPEEDIYFNVRLMSKLREMPAMVGGESSSPRFLPFVSPSIGAEEECEVLDTLRSGWLTTGPKVERFERRFAEYVGASNAVAVSSCTAALHLSLVVAGVGAGDEVISSPLTWPSTANVIIHEGATPVFVDVDRSALNIDPELLERAISPRTKAIIPVHIAGLPCDMDAIRAVADGHGLCVIEDAAHALGGEYRGKRIGTISEFTCFSFYPIKNITTIEGGMITVAQEDVADRLRVLSNFGMSKGAWKRYSKEHSGFHPAEVVYPGYKYNMTDVQASLGLHQLEKLAGFLSAREKYTQIYDRAFADVDEITVATLPSHVKHARHLYIIALDIDRLKIKRNEFVDALRAENIGTGI